MDKENLEDEDLQNAEENEEEDESPYEDGEDDSGEGEEPREGDEEENEDDDLLEDEEEPQSRSSKRFQSLANARRDAEAKTLRLEQELFQIRQQSMNGAGAQQRAEYLASLNESDRQIYLLQEQINQHNYKLQMAEFNAQDKSDQFAYEAEARVNPLYEKYAPQVEARLAELRTKNNLNAPRRDILAYIIGERVLKSKTKPVNKSSAKKRVQAQKTKPANNSSNVTTSKSKDPRAERIARLEGYKF